MSEAVQTSAVQQGEIALCVLCESKTNPRIHHDEHAHAELTESVRKLGVLQAILVRPIVRSKGLNYLPTDPTHEIVAGHRRFRAAKAAGLETIPANVRELTDVEVLEIQLVENLQRNDLHPLDEAEGYRRLMATKKYDAARIAERTGRSVKYVYDRIKLLDLAAEAKQLFREDAITAGHAILLARLSPKDQKRAISDRGGLFEGERLLVHPPNRYHGGEDRKPVSVREFASWIDDQVRLHPDNVEPMLFPESAQVLATAKEAAEKVVQITHEHMLPAHKKGDVKTFTRASWKRVDAKPCDFAVTGVVVIGYGRGEAFKVCIAKDRCKKHWAKEMKERESRTKTTGVDSGQKSQQERWRQEEQKRKAEQARLDAERARYEKALPRLRQAFIERVRSIEIRPGGPIDQLLTVRGFRRSREVPIERGSTPEDLVRYLAGVQLLDALDEWSAHREAPDLGKAFGVDVKGILDEVAPLNASEAAEKPKKKPRGKKAGAA